LTANISRTGHDIDKKHKIYREQSLLRWRKNDELLFANKKVIDADVDQPKFKIRSDFRQL